MSTGIINGGWEYVWAAYSLVWFGLLAYGVSLVRKQKQLHHARMDQEPTP